MLSAALEWELPPSVEPIKDQKEKAYIESVMKKKLPKG